MLVIGQPCKTQCGRGVCGRPPSLAKRFCFYHWTCKASCPDSLREGGLCGRKRSGPKQKNIVPRVILLCDSVHLTYQSFLS